MIREPLQDFSPKKHRQQPSLTHSFRFRHLDEAQLVALRDFLEGNFAKWQLPENWTLIPEVPKTSVGKFDKKRLRAEYHDGGFEVTRL